ncbi:cell division cycle protein-like protein 23 [Venturia nashicola]|nr:cell division cycle protein-like protein 23 [Venturia nashicola]
MANLSDRQLAEMQFHLQTAVQGCIDRCLFHSAKWAAELLNSIPQTEADLTNGSDTNPNSPMPMPMPLPMQDNDDFIPPPTDHEQDLLEKKEHHKFLLAKTYFDCREFDRCAAVFLPRTIPHIPLAQSSPTSKKKGKAPERPSRGGNSPNAGVSFANVSQKALFLSIYARYLSGEKRKDEESEMILGPQDGAATQNKELTGISAILEQWLNERYAQDQDGGGWLEFLYGMILSKGKNEDLAKEWLIRSVTLCPFNWGAWQELAHLIGTVDELAPIVEERLPRNIMTYIFHVFVSQELAQATEQVHDALTEVLSFFPHSLFLQSQRALLYWHSKDFDDSVHIFETLIQADPYRLDSLDQYSNCLYVLNDRTKLAFLAHLASSTDKFRPETCCIVGNYYSTISEHEKAVMYFRRALQLDRNYLSAWTLMGHEYIELKNSHCALEAYRRAVDANRKDHRAWYGMGQTYEVLEMQQYALFYYQKAAALRPFESKTWQAVGDCYKKIGRMSNAIRAYKRALVAGSWVEQGGQASFGSDSSALASLGGGVLNPEDLYKIAILYDRLEERDECAAYMELCLAQEDGLGANGDDEEDITPNTSGLYGSQAAPSNGAGGVGVTATTSKARMWLAKFALNSGDWEKANTLANELCQDGVEVEDAKAIVADVRSRRERGSEHH